MSRILNSSDVLKIVDGVMKAWHKCEVSLLRNIERMLEEPLTKEEVIYLNQIIEDHVCFDDKTYESIKIKISKYEGVE